MTKEEETALEKLEETLNTYFTIVIGDELVTDKNKSLEDRLNFLSKSLDEIT